MKHLSGTPATPQVSQIYLIYKLKEHLALLHATEHQKTLSILIDNSTPSVILTVLFAVVSSSHFFNFFFVVTHGKRKLLYGESSVLLSVKLTQLGWLLEEARGGGSA